MLFFPVPTQGNDSSLNVVIFSKYWMKCAFKYFIEHWWVRENPFKKQELNPKSKPHLIILASTPQLKWRKLLSNHHHPNQTFTSNHHQTNQKQ